MKRVAVALMITALTVLLGATDAAARTATVPKPSKAKPVPVDVASVEKKITQVARDRAKALGITAGKARCPKGVAADRPRFSFQCTIPYEGVQAAYVVTLDAAKMSFDIQPRQAILATSLLSKFVKDNLEGDAAALAAAKIDCGKGKVVVRPVGGTVECAVTSPMGGAIVVISVVDVNGRVTIVGNKPLNRGRK